MPSYTGSITLSAVARLYITPNNVNARHEYVAAMKNDGTAIYVQQEYTSRPSIIFKDWRDGNWKGAVNCYLIIRSTIINNFSKYVKISTSIF